jgi:hypothetical protein
MGHVIDHQEPTPRSPHTVLIVGIKVVSVERNAGLRVALKHSQDRLLVARLRMGLPQQDNLTSDIPQTAE